MMNIKFKNLGVIKQADLTLGDLTIVCGKNNTGKTYVTYATYGFLDYWHNELSVEFQKELDFTRSRLVDLIGERGSKISSTKLLDRFSSEYPMPVKRNVDFIRYLPSLLAKESMFSKQNPEVLEAFSDIIGGQYKVNQDAKVQYIPSKNRKIKLTMVESSSAVRSLLDIGFYLRHVAQTGDLLIVDEPELNLHPENQRKVARLFAMLVNHGIKVFITTHSDYIIKELNTPILLNNGGERLQVLAEREGYKTTELLNSDNLSVYIAKESLISIEGRKRKSRCHTLVKADVTNENGIAIESFDTTIEDMNRIQDEIVWGK